MHAVPNDGFRIVLTADRTLMASYPTLLDGMTAASQTTTTPPWVMQTLVAPPAATDGVRVRRAPLGLRRIEAALVRDGVERADVAIVPPELLGQAVGPATRLVALSSGDPLGAGMNSSTMAGIAGGTIYTRSYFTKLCRLIAGLRRGRDFRVVMGGPGAWQLADRPKARRRLGIDHVVTGYCEANVAELFGRLIGDDDTPVLLEGQQADPEAAPPVLGPTSMGIVEIGRGCGWGCRFCTLARVPMMDLPAETILADVAANAADGPANIGLISEDFFRYGAGTRRRADPDALIGLLERVRQVPDVRLVQTDHANIATVAAWPDDALAEARRLMVANAGNRRPWINLGMETAAGELLAAHGGTLKMRPFGPEQWADVCFEQTCRVIDAGFLPMVSLVMGLPGETRDHVRRTLRWVDRLDGRPVTIFPMLHAPLDQDRQDVPPSPAMAHDHWRLVHACYRHNFRWVPRMIWDNQTYGGVGLARRLLLQAMGQGQIRLWRMLFVARAAGLLP